MPYVTNANMLDMMTAAIEGGSAFWMNDDDILDVSVVRDANKNVTCISFRTDVCGNMQSYTIDAVSMRKALKLMKMDAKQPEHLQKLAHKMLTDPNYDYDAGDADAIVQYAAFQEVVFG